jgi:hypothetical protein
MPSWRKSVDNLTDTERLATPAPPDNAPVVLKVGRAVIACNPSPGSPGVYGGPPDRWEPPEEGDIGETFILLKSKKTWIRVDADVFDSIDDILERTWTAYDDMVNSLWEDRADYYMEERCGL